VCVSVCVIIVVVAVVAVVAVVVVLSTSFYYILWPLVFLVDSAVRLTATATATTTID